MPVASPMSGGRASSQGKWAGLVPLQVVVVETVPWMWEATLSPREATSVRGAAPNRVREFRAGRAAARLALAELGILGFDLVAGPARNPLWPEGVVGSITHTRDYGAVAVARMNSVSAIGIDAEPNQPLDEELIPTICLASEVAHITERGDCDPGRLARLVFTMKEAFYKAYFPAAGTFLDHHDVAVEIDFDAGRFTASLRQRDVPRLLGLTEVEGRFRHDDDLMRSAVTVRGSTRAGEPEGGVLRAQRPENPDGAGNQ